METTESEKSGNESKIRRRIEQKIDAQLRDTFPASDVPNYGAVEREARQEIEAENSHPKPDIAQPSHDNSTATASTPVVNRP